MNNTGNRYSKTLIKYGLLCHELGAYGMTISGAGPSLFVAVKEGTQEEIAKKLEKEFPYYRAIAVTPAPIGSTIKKDAH